MLYFRSNSNLHGIIRYLLKNKKLYKAEVTVKGSSNFIHETYKWGVADTILDQKNTLKSSDCWCSEDKKNQYVDINFKTYHAKVTSFSIKPNYYNMHIIRNFTLQGSNSTDNFVDIYRHDGTNLTNNAVNTFDCQNTETYNHFRIMMLDTSTNPISWFFIICAVEFFGYVTDLSLYQSCLNKRHRIIRNAIFFMISGVS